MHLARFTQRLYSGTLIFKVKLWLSCNKVLVRDHMDSKLGSQECLYTVNLILSYSSIVVIKLELSWSEVLAKFCR